MAEILPEHIGPYRLLNMLGQGGMGTVFRAQHTETEKLVALKTVRMPKAGRIQGIRQEIHALSRMKHPGIINIYDVGDHDGCPWYAMELLEGITLRHYSLSLTEQVDTVNSDQNFDFSQMSQETGTESYSDWRIDGHNQEETLVDVSKNGQLSHPLTTPFSHFDHPKPVKKSEKYILNVLSFIRTLCRPLSYLHGEGVVHRDLKPDNIMVRSDKTPVIVDFGLVTRFGGQYSREELMMSVGRTVGTISYISPEQIRGELVDARSDIYSLGCILYEMLTDRPPFIGDHLQIIQSHLSDEIIPLEHLVSDIDPRVADLLQRMLSKDPADRIGYVDTVAAILGECGAEDRFGEIHPKTRFYLYRPGFTGRQKKLNELYYKLDLLEQKVGDLVLIGGETGVGKTRFSLEIARQASNKKFNILIGECTERGSQPLEVMLKPLQMIGDRCRESGPEETKMILGARGKVLARYEHSLDLLPGQDEYPKPEKLSPNEEQYRLFQYLAETFGSLAVSTPVLLILDDIQWVDDMTINFLKYLVDTEFLKDQPILVLAAYRTEEVHSRLQELIHQHAMNTIILKRLDDMAISSIITNMLALDYIPAKFGQFMANHSEGNPFFVAEFLRSSVENGILKRDDKGNWTILEISDVIFFESFEYKIAVPQSIHDLVERRLEGLPEESLKLVRSAAVIGREFDQELVLNILLYDDFSFSSAIQELFRRQVIEYSPDDKLRFCHNTLREVVYNSIPSELKIKLHRDTAQTIEVLYKSNLDHYHQALAKHWDLGGDVDKARSYYYKVAIFYSDQNIAQNAVEYFQEYLRITPEINDNSLKARIRLAQALNDQGKPERAMETAKETLKLVRDFHNFRLEMEILRVLAIIYSDRGFLDKALEHLQQALVLADHCQTPGRQGTILCSIFNVHQSLGNFDLAIRASTLALKLLRKVGDKAIEAIVISNLAIFEKELNNNKRARKLYEQALVIHREAGDRRSEAFTLMNLANVMYDQGEKEKAISVMHKAKNIFREIGSIRSVATTMNNLADMYHETGDNEKAKQLYAETIPLVQGLQELVLEAHTYCNYGILNRDLGELDLARDNYTHAKQCIEKSGAIRSTGIINRYLGQLERLRGHYDLAWEYLETARTTLEKVDDQIAIALCLCEMGHLALAQQKPAEEFLESVTSIAKDLGDNIIISLNYAINKLKKAITLYNEHCFDKLYSGEPIEDMPVDLRNRLVK